ncbi:MAG: TlpA family protein disulfide reductase [Proteobacteria bacterium]|nr:TlpA family protein disulfide reductase [Pseudomonadota bacterium]
MGVKISNSDYLFDMKNYYKTIKKHKLGSFFLDLVFILLILFAFSWWQNRGTLVVDGAVAPDFQLASLDGKTYNLADYRGKQVLLYFFAPWCGICHASAGNLNDLRAARSEDELVILMIGLSYESVDELHEFSKDLDMQVPILLGSDQLGIDYKIKAFPTYYVIDEKGVLKSRALGYSTELGMRLRT